MNEENKQEISYENALQLQLTLEIYNSIPPKEIIYAEIAHTGAMGNVGGIILYTIKELQLICYNTSIYKDVDLYSIIDESLSKNDIDFNLIPGGMGNIAYVNKSADLKISDDYFNYIKNGYNYKIFSTVRGVFNNVKIGLDKLRKPNEE